MKRLVLVFVALLFVSTAAADGRLSLRSDWRLRNGFAGRQIDFKAGALAWLTVNGDAPSTLLDNAVNSSQAQAGAFARLFGGEERLKDARPGCLIHALAGVGHRQHNARAGGSIELNLATVLVEFEVASLNGQPAAGWHGIAGVNHQVHNNLFKLVGIGGDGP